MAPADASLAETTASRTRTASRGRSCCPWQAVRAADQTGMCTRVLAMMSVLSAAGVRRELLYVAGQAGVLATGAPGRRRPGGPGAGVAGGRSLLTISLDGQTVMLHRLMARMIRDGLSAGGGWAAVC